MKNNIFQKLNTARGHLVAADLSVQEKGRLFGLMAQNGATHAFAYIRFFRDGFSEWELEGIDKILSEFCKEHDIVIPEDSSLYEAMPHGDGIRVALYRMMDQKGMSPNTTRKRFLAKDFKPWERKGIRAIVDEFIKGQQAQ